MADALIVLLQVFGLLFVVGSMLAMGFSLTLNMIVQPLKDWRLDLLGLIGNFVIVPAIIIGTGSVLDLPDDVKIGFYILALAAGAPFLPKLTQFAKGNIAYAVGLMTMLMVVSIMVLPLVLPLIVEGVKINPWDVAKPLIFLMLTPLGIALFIKQRYPDFADHAAKLLNSVTTISLFALLFLFFAQFWEQIIDTFGTGTIGFAIFFIAIALVIGYFLGGKDQGTKRVSALGTAQRNIAAGILTATVNFQDRPMVGVTVLVVSLVGLVMLMILAGEWGRKKSDEGSASKKESPVP